MTSLQYSISTGASSRGRTESPAAQRAKYSSSILPSSLTSNNKAASPNSISSGQSIYPSYPLSVNRNTTSSSTHSRFTKPNAYSNSYDLYSYNRSNFSGAYNRTSSVTPISFETNKQLSYKKTNLLPVDSASSSSSTSKYKLEDNFDKLKLDNQKKKTENEYLSEIKSERNKSSTSSQYYSNKSSKLSPSSTSVSTTSSSSQSIKTNYYDNGANSLSENISNQQMDNSLSQKGFVGLKNLGNTCFMNSILQCLSNTKFLLEYILSGAYTNDLNTTLSTMKGTLFQTYALLIKRMWKGSDVVVNPQDFRLQLIRYSPNFSGYAQQDAEEFLTYLIKGLHEDVNLIKSKPPSMIIDEKTWDRMSDSEKSEAHWSWNFRSERSKISDMFVGQLKSTLMCTKCDYRSPTYELFWDLAVPIPTKNSSIKLDDCIKLFMSEEILDGENKPVCSNCKQKRRCAKRYTIEKLPKILVIHLKRFLKARYNNKINLNVDYPIEDLDMSKYLSPNVVDQYSNRSVYDLYGISLHSGTESSGHYVAYCKNPYNKKWFCFNDQLIREVSQNSLQDSNAYILFYQLRT